MRIELKGRSNEEVKIDIADPTYLRLRRSCYCCWFYKFCECESYFERIKEEEEVEDRELQWRILGKGEERGVGSEVGRVTECIGK